MADRNGFTVARVGDDGRIAVAVERLAKTWPDETVIEDFQVERAGDAWQFVIHGVDTSGSFVSYTIPVEFTPDGSLRMKPAADDESKADAVNKCIGHNCSRCTWSGMSCSCQIGSGTCDHELITSFTPADVFLKQ